jgi:hypothetical protein
MAVTVLVRKLDDPNINLGFVMDISDGFRQYGSQDLAVHVQVYLPNITRDEVMQLMAEYDEQGNFTGRRFRMKLDTVAQIAAAGNQYTYDGNYKNLERFLFEQR